MWHSCDLILLQNHFRTHHPINCHPLALSSRYSSTDKNFPHSSITNQTTPPRSHDVSSSSSSSFSPIQSRSYDQDFKLTSQPLYAAPPQMIFSTRLLRLTAHSHSVACFSVVPSIDSIVQSPPPPPFVLALCFPPDRSHHRRRARC